MSLADELARAPLFHGAERKFLQQVAAISRPIRLSSREVVFPEGGPAEGFYVLLEGRVILSRTSPDGKEQVLHIVEPPHTFAEAAVFGGGDYPATAKTLTECRLIFVPKREFLSLLSKNPDFSLQIIRSLSLWLRRMVDLVEDVSLRDVESRFLRYLKEKASLSGIPIEEGSEIYLDVEKSVIASRIGTVPETFSRMLRRLSDKGVLRVEGKRVTILDAEVFDED